MHPVFNNGRLQPKLTVPRKIHCGLYSRLDETIRETAKPDRLLRHACRLNRHARHESLQSLNGKSETTRANGSLPAAPVYFSDTHDSVKNIHRLLLPQTEIEPHCLPLRAALYNRFISLCQYFIDEICEHMAFPTTSLRIAIDACDHIMRSVRQNFFALPIW